MLQHKIGGAIAVIVAVAVPSTGLAAIENVTPGVIFGTGNANGSFTISQNNNVEIGLRGKLRHDASGQPQNTFNWDGVNTYTFNAGVAPTQSYPTAVWSFEWSINTDLTGTSGVKLDDLTYVLSLDKDPGVGATDFFTFDPINVSSPDFWDHSIGDNSTTAATDLVASNYGEYSSYIATYNVAQNSWKPHWFIPGFDPNTPGEYTISLAAYDNLGLVASASINIEAVVPEPASLVVWSLLGITCGTVIWRRRRNGAA